MPNRNFFVYLKNLFCSNIFIKYKIWMIKLEYLSELWVLILENINVDKKQHLYGN